MAEIMTAYEVAALLRIHIRTIYKLAEQGAVPGNKIGRSWRFNKRDILKLVSKKRSDWQTDGPGREEVRPK